MERDFKGVWISKNIWESKELNVTEKFLMIEIDSLSQNERGCFASNQYLGDFLGLSKNTVANMISKLAKKGFLEVELTYHPGTKNVDKRYINLTDKFKYIQAGMTVDDLGKVSFTSSQKNEGGIHKKMNTPIHKKVKDTNTVIINTNETTTSDVPSSSSYEFLENEEFNKLNEPTKKNLRNIVGLDYETLKIVYDYAMNQEKNKKIKNFNAFVYQAVKNKWVLEVKNANKEIHRKAPISNLQEVNSENVTKEKIKVKQNEYETLCDEHNKKIKHLKPELKEFLLQRFKEQFEITNL